MWAPSCGHKGVSWLLQCPHALWLQNLPNFHVNNFVSMAITRSHYKNLSSISSPRWKRGGMAVVMKALHRECLSIFRVWTQSKSQSSGGPLSMLERLFLMTHERYKYFSPFVQLPLLSYPYLLVSPWDGYFPIFPISDRPENLLENHKGRKGDTPKKFHSIMTSSI